MSQSAITNHCAQLVRNERPDAFLASLYVAAECRAVLHVLLALDVEFSHIAGAAKEELIAHMRYAWWEEALEKTYAGHPPVGHPVLEELTKMEEAVPQGHAVELLHSYRSQYPEVPEGVVDDWVAELLLTQAQQGRWDKAQGIIRTHRARYGSKKNGLLKLKLLINGII